MGVTAIESCGPRSHDSGSVLVDGYVANTDFDWYTFLAGQPSLDEINFWQPSGGHANFHVLSPGEPLFFRLKNPHNAIAGFGSFARHERGVRSSLAWSAFGIKNGAPDLVTMRRRIEKYRGSSAPADRDPQVGCLMIAQPVFLPRASWIPQPADWKPNIVQGKGYDVTVGEGLRIYEACRASVTSLEFQGLRVLGEPVERYGAEQIVRPRLGQGIFRVAVNAAYEGACAITGEHSQPVLEAAHIRPYALDGEHDVQNGVLLRSDIHRLFDDGYVTVTTDHRFEVSRRLKEEFDNGKTYYALHGHHVRLPKAAADRPSGALLTWHNENVFLG